MTRKEQIKQAAIEYATHLTDIGEMDYYGHFEKAQLYIYFSRRFIW